MMFIGRKRSAHVVPIYKLLSYRYLMQCSRPAQGKQAWLLDRQWLGLALP